MTGRYKAYPTYKSSTFEWLGDIPKHWDVVYSKWLFSERKVKAQPTDEMLTASQKYGVIPQKMFMELEQQKVVQVQKGHDILKQVKKNDFVISMRSFQGGIEFCDYDGAVSSAYVPLEPRNNGCSTYFKYLFKSKPYIQALQATTNLVRDGQALRFTNFTQVRLPFPTESEAQFIGAFLDHETAKIDTLIAKQEKLIELLKEKRQAVISHAVTKGLNPDAPMKDSGVEWLGNVPEHWDMKRLKYIGEAKNGLTYSPDDVVPEGEGVLVLRSSNIQDAKLSFTDNVYVNMDIPLRIRTQKDDLLICSRNGSRQLIGKNALITEEAVDMAFGAFMVVFRSKLNPYLYWVLNSPLFEYQSGSFLTSTINQLTIGNLESMEIPLPPSDEQELIRQYLIEKMDYFDQLISKSACKVDLLKERKTALISAAVTGKVDVRDWQESA
ncbi:restriction endonuclease subunit S [Vibrio parahaemolyticus]|nr:restriction endonuclease subunit S [Vibrio parahaemolyticus]